MKLKVTPEQFAQYRMDALRDELEGRDPGAAWKHRYPDATEIEFVVEHRAVHPTGAPHG